TRPGMTIFPRPSTTTAFERGVRLEGPMSAIRSPSITMSASGRSPRCSSIVSAHAPRMTIMMPSPRARCPRRRGYLTVAGIERCVSTSGILRAILGAGMTTPYVLGGLTGRAVLALLALGLMMQSAPSRLAAQAEDALDVVKVRKNFYMIAGAGGNIG